MCNTWCFTLSAWVGDKEGEKKINSYASKVSRGWLLSPLQGRGWERVKQQRQRGRREGGSGWEVREIATLLNALALSPTKMDTISFSPVMLAGYGSSQHCLHTLMHYTYTCTCMFRHIHTHTLHTCCSCKWYLLSFFVHAFSAAVFCGRKTNIDALNIDTLCWKCRNGHVHFHRQKETFI